MSMGIPVLDKYASFLDVSQMTLRVAQEFQLQLRTRTIVCEIVTQ